MRAEGERLGDVHPRLSVRVSRPWGTHLDTADMNPRMHLLISDNPSIEVMLLVISAIKYEVNFVVVIKKLVIVG